ncbi:winged helix-turn-helix transcriptional regulator [Undibacterium sp. TJN19]|uniref:winged helix-turn-helix transcriptional regulator n=1 Tax=Undibacterium sp. TJN19 TaxID=3413055 RepID=UPI003BF1DE6A
MSGPSKNSPAAPGAAPALTASSTPSTTTPRHQAGQPLAHPHYTAARDPQLEALVRDIISRVADKWTMVAIEVLSEHGTLRFTRIGELMGDVSQKMLTKTLRQMEADGLVLRTVYPVIPPKVEYALTDLGLSLGAAFCGVWLWAEEHRHTITAARQAFEGKGDQ